MNRWLEQYLHHSFFRRDEHFSDERMAAFFCGELAFSKRWLARLHLFSCADCKKRYAELTGPRAEHAVRIYQQILSDEDMPSPFLPRATLAQWLHVEPGQQRARAEAVREETAFVSPFAAALRTASYSWTTPVLPAFLAGVAVSLIVVMPLGWFWSRQHRPMITANALLVRAETWDTPNPIARPGVVRQTIQIKTGNQTLRRPVYWDLQGKRRMRKQELSSSEEQLRSVLVQAGIDWNQPMSASAYQEWHDHQHVREDRIVRSGSHLLTLTTTVPEGAVLEESITVRDVDFHPVEHTVQFRDAGKIDIAEVDFAILPWSGIDSDVFEPLAPVPGGLPRSFSPLRPALRITSAASPEQLDETELAARLILNQLHADTGEQIEIRRTPSTVEVDGLVETEERRRQLVAALMTVPRLSIALQSSAQIMNERPKDSDPVITRAATLPDQPSALDRSMRARGIRTDEINVMAEQIFAGALTISQESNAISDLEARFALADNIPVISRATLEDLLYSHRERLEEALRRQRVLLAQAAPSTAPEEGFTSREVASLSSEAARNLALARELTQTNAVTRDASAVIADMSAADARLTVALNASRTVNGTLARNPGRK